MKVSTVVAAMLVAFVSSYIVYFGFTSNYTLFVYSPDSFRIQYDHDIYKYRLLSKYLLLGMDNLLAYIMPAGGAEPRLRIMDSHASERFYYAYFCLNTFFLMLLAVVLAFLLELDVLSPLKQAEKKLILFFIPVLLCLTQFVICPYDISSYFFQLLTIYLFFSGIDQRYRWTVVITSLLIIPATVNRESSSITVAFLILIALYKWGWSGKAWGSIIAFAISFLVPYLSLRLFIKDPPGWKSPDTLDKFQLNVSWDLSHWGLVYWALLTWLVLALCRQQENRLLIFWYYLACLPYIWTCLVSGVLWELRLFVPIFLGALVISQLDVSQFNSPLAVRARRTDWL